MSLLEVLWNRYRREMLEMALLALLATLIAQAWLATDFEAAARGFAQWSGRSGNPDISMSQKISILEKPFATRQIDSILADSLAGWTRLSTGQGIWLAQTKGRWSDVGERLGKLEVLPKDAVLDSVAFEWISAGQPLGLLVRLRRLP